MSGKANTDGFVGIYCETSLRRMNRYATEIEAWQEVREIDRINRLGYLLRGMGRWWPNHADSIKAHGPSAGGPA